MKALIILMVNGRGVVNDTMFGIEVPGMDFDASHPDRTDGLQCGGGAWFSGVFVEVAS